MGDLLYFVEGSATVPASQPRLGEVLGHWGIGHLVGDLQGIEPLPVSVGPRGAGSGLVLRMGQAQPTTAGSPRPLKLDESVQRWVRFPEDERVGDAPRVWCGWWTADPPGPKALARPKMSDGPRITLGDGNQWKVPHLAQAERVVGCDDDGHRVMLLPPRLEALGEAVARCEEIFHGEGSASDHETFEAVFGLAWTALAVNYRVDAHVVRALALLPEFAWPVYFAATRGRDEKWTAAHLERMRALSEAAPTSPSFAEAATEGYEGQAPTSPGASSDGQGNTDEHGQTRTPLRSERATAGHADTDGKGAAA